MEGFNLNTERNGCALTVKWNSIKNADGYFVMAKDAYCVYNIIVDVEEPFCNLNQVDCTQMYGLSVAAYVKGSGGKHIVSQSEEIELEQIKREYMNIRALQSYNGVTLSWIDNTTDRGRYYVMKKIGGSYAVINYTEDDQVTLRDVKIDDSFIIASVNDKTEITMLSEEFTYSVPVKGQDRAAQERKKVSVIVPVYNNERYIPRCIDSILLSTLDATELILVDDGSCDSSPEIVDWYRDNYPDKVVAVHQENAGAAAARNSGILCAQGEYISFVDSDDIVHPRMLELLYNDAAALDCDIAAGQYFRLSANNGKFLRYKLPCVAHKAYDTTEMLKVIYSEGFGTVAIWHKLYRSSLIKPRLIPEIKYEDVAWTPYIISHAKSFCFVPVPLYCWDRRVEYTKSTLSNIFSVMDANEKFENRRCAFDYYLENGNREKIDCLCYVAIKRVIQCARKYPKKDRENPYYKYICELHEKYDLSANKFIIDDKEYFAKVSEVLAAK